MAKVVSERLRPVPFSSKSKMRKPAHKNEVLLEHAIAKQRVDETLQKGFLMRNLFLTIWSNPQREHR